MLFLEKLTVTQLVKPVPAFYRKRKSVIAFTTALMMAFLGNIDCLAYAEVEG
jgi:hypothetical protein